MMVSKRHRHIVLRAVKALCSTRKKHSIFVQQRLKTHQKTTTTVPVNLRLIQSVPVRAANFQQDVFSAPWNAQKLAIG